MKTRFVCTALLFLLLASCGGEKKEQPAAKIIDPVWGLWVQQIPDGTAKFELMFNEDKSGFLFVDDALKFKIEWEQDSLLHVRYKEPTNPAEVVVTKSFEKTMKGDTLWLRDIDSNNSEKLLYLRFKQ